MGPAQVITPGPCTKIQGRKVALGDAAPWGLACGYMSFLRTTLAARRYLGEKMESL